MLVTKTTLLSKVASLGTSFRQCHVIELLYMYVCIFIFFLGSHYTLIMAGWAEGTWEPCVKTHSSRLDTSVFHFGAAHLRSLRNNEVIHTNYLH